MLLIVPWITKKKKTDILTTTVSCFLGGSNIPKNQFFAFFRKKNAFLGKRSYVKKYSTLNFPQKWPRQPL